MLLAGTMYVRQPFYKTTSTATTGDNPSDVSTNQEGGLRKKTGACVERMLDGAQRPNQACLDPTFGQSI